MRPYRPEDVLDVERMAREVSARFLRRRLNELERAGWSLPVYREMILADAARLNF